MAVDSSAADNFGFYTVQVATNATSSGNAGGTKNRVNRFIDYSSFRVITDNTVLSKTDVKYKFRGRRFANGVLASFQDVIPDTEVTLRESYLVRDSDDASATLQIDLTSRKNSVSPVIDTLRTSIIAQKNIVNNTPDIFNNNNSGAVARYVQNPITSITPSNMIDVFLDCNIPAGSTVKLYYRVG